MREIKFRTWDKTFKRMCSLREFDPAIIVQEGCFTIYQGDDCGFEFMQYTGLKDKNGKEIYEGDIIYDNIIKMKRVVTDIMVAWWIIDTDKMNEPMKHIKVIGNIYENKSLTEK